MGCCAGKEEIEVEVKEVGAPATAPAPPEAGAFGRLGGQPSKSDLGQTPPLPVDDSASMMPDLSSTSEKVKLTDSESLLYRFNKIVSDDAFLSVVADAANLEGEAAHASLEEAAEAAAAAMPASIERGEGFDERLRSALVQHAAIMLPAMRETRAWASASSPSEPSSPPRNGFHMRHGTWWPAAEPENVVGRLQPVWADLAPQPVNPEAAATASAAASTALQRSAQRAADRSAAYEAADETTRWTGDDDNSQKAAAAAAGKVRDRCIIGLGSMDPERTLTLLCSHV
jgi:hypothetical protein